MDASTAALIALVGAVAVLSAVVLLGAWLYQRAETAHRAEVARLTNLAISRDPREFAVLQKASTPKAEPAEPREPEIALIGT